MRGFARSYKQLTAVIAFFALLVALAEAWSIMAPTRGRRAAQFDVERGHYRILSYGLPPSWLPEYARLLKERYDVDLYPVAGCIVSKDLVSYVDAYDEISASAVNHKFGRNVFEESAEEARKQE
jgi:hypothetical protein